MYSRAIVRTLPPFIKGGMRFSKKGYNWGDGNFLLEMGGGEVRNGEWGRGMVLKWEVLKNSDDQQNTWSSSYKIRPRNIFNNIKEHLITWPKWGPFDKTIQTGSSFSKKVSISILFQKVCLGWKLLPIINKGGGGVGKRMSWGGKIEELARGMSIGYSREKYWGILTLFMFTN